MSRTQDDDMTKHAWADVEAHFRKKAYRTLAEDPEILLEQDGGPWGQKAELIYARLIGLEDEIVDDGMRLSRVEPEIRMPLLTSRGALSFTNEDLWPTEPLRVARYVLQSGFAIMHVSAEFLPPGVPTGPDNAARVLYLRYRRRL